MEAPGRESSQSLSQEATVKGIIRQAIANSSADYTETRIERRWLNRVNGQRFCPAIVIDNVNLAAK